MLKQVIVVRQDLSLPAGKLASQVAHASLEAALRGEQTVLSAWRDSGAKKIVVTCEDEEALEELCGSAEAEGLPVRLVQDAGHTVVDSGTLTALGIGPGEEERVDRVSGDQPLL